MDQKESWGIDAFELQCWEKTLESLFESKEIKTINPNVYIWNLERW